jgi:hypothetical protein
MNYIYLSHDYPSDAGGYASHATAA